MKRAAFLFLMSGALFAAPHHESVALQEMRVALDQVGYQIHSHQVEIDLFQERLARLEKSVEGFGRQLKQGSQDRTLEGRLAKLEKAHETLISDFKSLKGHLNETNSSLSACQTKLSQIDKQLSSDIKGLKSSLESMLSLLQKGEGASPTKIYVVKPGDSLGQIALDHRTDTRTLKQLNNLSTDTIYPGQKLSLP
ncbi:MAG: LysM peptidoglycan-binding domain-containing protein [Chlamydiales bacterium]|nr:LysM peptidoglycan-binding domain-containing protein [Chlamydiales bacterium]